MPLRIVADSFNDLVGSLAFLAAHAGRAKRLSLRLSLDARFIRLGYLGVLRLLDILLVFGVRHQVLHRRRELCLGEVGVHGVGVAFLSLIVVVNVKRLNAFSFFGWAIFMFLFLVLFTVTTGEHELLLVTRNRCTSEESCDVVREPIVDFTVLENLERLITDEGSEVVVEVLHIFVVRNIVADSRVSGLREEEFIARI